MAKSIKKYSSKTKKGHTQLPLTDHQEIKKLLSVPGRDGLLIKFGLYTGLRVSEIVTLSWQDVVNAQGRAKTHVEVVAPKQSNLQGRLVTRKLKMVEPLARAIEAFYREMGMAPLSRWIFYPEKSKMISRHLTDKGARDILKRWAVDLKLSKRDIAFHTLRKTCVTKYYQKNGLELTMQAFGWTSTKSLYRYLGITQEAVEAGYVDFYGDEYRSLTDMIEDGDIDINVQALIQGRPESKWGPILHDYFLQYSTDSEEIARVVRTLLAPFRGSRKQLLT